MQGGYRLHYTASYGAVDWQVVEAALRSPALQAVIQNLPEPSEAYIARLSAELGLRHQLDGGGQRMRRDDSAADLTPLYPDAGKHHMLSKRSAESLGRRGMVSCNGAYHKW